MHEARVQQCSTTCANVTSQGAVVLMNLMANTRKILGNLIKNPEWRWKGPVWPQRQLKFHLPACPQAGTANVIHFALILFYLSFSSRQIETLRSWYLSKFVLDWKPWKHIFLMFLLFTGLNRCGELFSLQPSQKIKKEAKKRENFREIE